MAGTDSADDKALRDATSECLTMKPNLQFSVKVNQIRDKLNKSRSKRNSLPKQSPIQPNNTTARTSARIEEKKKTDNSSQELAEAIKNLRNELDTHFESLNEIFEQLKALHERVDSIENRPSSQPQTYAAAAASPISDAQNNTRNKRLEILEYQSSETERTNRLLQATITHPAFESKRQNPYSAACNFMQSIMRMDRREVDANMYVQFTRHPNTILIHFSDHRFKTFLFRAKKNLPRNEHPIYINEHLTTYNYGILKLAKEERKRLNENLMGLFETIYTYNGRVFIKKQRTDPSSAAILIKTPEGLHELIAELTAENQ